MQDVCAIGVDLGGTSIRAALVSRDAQVSKHLQMPTPADAGAVAVVDAVCSLATHLGSERAGSEISCVGICTPGPLNTDAGKTVGVPTIEGFEHFPLKDEIQARLNWPVHVENDAAAAAFGEWRFGAGRSIQNMAFVTIGTGIGGGIIERGRLLRGHAGYAGHIGHMAIQDGGPDCSCGRAGCWEAFASGTALSQRAKKAGFTDSITLFQHARGGDQNALQVVDEEAHFLAIGLVNIAHLFSPELIVIGGGISQGFDLMASKLRQEFHASIMPAFSGIEIVETQLDLNAGIIGAAELARGRL